MEDCLRCSQLLAEYGEALLRFHELDKENEGLRNFRRADYDSAEAECGRLPIKAPNPSVLPRRKIN
jgi:hypothetical protein